VLGQELLPYFQALGLNPADGPDPARLAEGFHERADTLLHMVASARYCYEDFEHIEPKSARKNLRPVILEPLLAARDGLTGLAEWSRDAIAQVIDETAASFEISMGKLGQPIRVAVTGGPVSPPIDVTLELVGQKRTISRLDSAIAFVEARAAASEG
jgi:glutamyl-tRNA synthetase